MLKVSATTPCPATAESPWIVIGNTFEPDSSPKRSCRARTELTTAGFNNFKVRCDSRQEQGEHHRLVWRNRQRNLGDI